MFRRFTVRVPATTANLGPGFDCLGMALDIHNTIVLEPSYTFEMNICGEGEGRLPLSISNLTYRALATLYEEVGRSVPPLRILCQNNIPLGRGLGSSGAAAVAGLMAANHLLGQPCTRDQLLQLATRLEGHPDNVAPALLGGCQVVIQDQGKVIAAPIPLPEGLKAVLFIPDFEMPTYKSRRLLPSQVSREDAIYNIGRVSLLVAALANGHLDLLRLATQDRLHQPARESLFPAMPQIFEAALEAGALAAFLSGGGSTILALTLEKEITIANALALAGEKAGLVAKTQIAKPTPQGAEVIEE